MKHFKRLLPFLSIWLVLFWAANSSASTKMPSFVLPDVVSGEEVSSISFRGKALLLTFFATWCPPCVEEIPNLIALQKEFSGRGFSVLGMSVDQGGAKVVKRLVERKSINYPVVLADAKTMQAFGGIFGIPVSFLVNKSGNVVKKYTGYVPKSILEKDLRRIL